MKKVLAIFMAIAMVATMFSFSVVSFAEGEAETPALEESRFLIGGSTVSGVKPHNASSTGRTEAKAISLLALDAVNGGRASKSIMPVFEEEVASGLYSAIVLQLKGSPDTTITINGLKGSETTPIVIKQRYDAATRPVVKSNSTENKVAAIVIENCENIIIESVEVTAAANNGIEIRNSKNITIKNVGFRNVGYTDYTLPVSTDAETGEQTFPNMETEALLAKGSAVLVGANNENVTVEACTFDSCRAGVVVDHSVLEVETEEDETEVVAEEDGTEEEAAPVASKDVAILNSTFTNINEAGVIVNGAEDVLVSGGSATKVGNLVSAEDYDLTSVAVVKLADAVNVTVEKIFSSYNECFVDSSFSSGRIRYNVSDSDLSSFVLSETAADMLVYNNTFVNASSLFIDATAKNNIFAMFTAGEKVVVTEGEANCYYWTSKGDRNSIKKNPAFANAFDGSDLEKPVINNYILSTKSPCLGKGVQVEEDMGDTDFYGNEIGTSHNIGADEGAGAEATTKIVNAFVDFFNYLFALIKNFFGIK